MPPKTKSYVFLITFVSILFVYLFLAFLFPHSPLARLTSMFHNMVGDFIFLVFLSLVGAFCLYDVIYMGYVKLVQMRWRRTRLGKALVSEGYITERDLRAALSQQRFRMGEVLVQAGRITANQLEYALYAQKKAPAKLGEVLKALGHTTDEDIKWALDRMNKKLGKILREMGLITTYDLGRILAKQRYGPRHGRLLAFVSLSDRELFRRLFPPHR